MGFLLRTIIGIVGVTVVGGFIVNQIPSLRESAIEFINPTAKESRLISDLDSNLSQLEARISSPTNDGRTSEGPTAATTKDLITKSRSLISDLRDANQNNSGLVRSTVSTITKALFDNTPHPASDPTAQSQNSGTPQPCPTQ